jgi:hypothetical protein
MELVDAAHQGQIVRPSDRLGAVNPQGCSTLSTESLAQQLPMI